MEPRNGQLSASVVQEMMTGKECSRVTSVGHGSTHTAVALQKRTPCQDCSSARRAVARL